MTCEICGEKGSWCDCTDSERQMHEEIAELQRENELLNDRIAELERRLDIAQELMT